MDMESHIHPVFSSASNLTSPAGILFSSDSPTGGSRSRTFTSTHSPSAPTLRHTLSSTLPAPTASSAQSRSSVVRSTFAAANLGERTASSSEAPRTADTDEDLSPRQQALLAGRCSNFPLSQKRRARYVRSGSLNLETKPVSPFESDDHFGTFIPAPPLRTSTPANTRSMASQSVYSRASHSPGQLQPGSVASLDPSVSSRGGSVSTVMEQPRREWAGRDDNSYGATEAGVPSRKKSSRAPAGGGHGSGHSSLQSTANSDLIQPQSFQHPKQRHSSLGHAYLQHPNPHQQQQHSSLGSSRLYGRKYATSCSSSASADDGGLHVTTVSLVSQGPPAGMFLNMRNRNSVDNSLTLSSPSPSPSAYASTQHSERDTHRSYPIERRGSGSGGSRDRSSSAYAPNHGRMTHTYPDLLTTPHRPPRSSTQMEAQEEDSNSNTRWRSKLSSGSGSPATNNDSVQAMSRRPSATVHNHYVDISSLM